MSENRVNLPQAQDYLRKILLQELSAPESRWLSDKYELLTNEPEKGDFYLTFSSVTRFIQRKPWAATPDIRQEAEKIMQGWRPYLWTTDQTCRVFLLSLYTPTAAAESLPFIRDVFDTADMREQVAIFSALPILPNPATYTQLASEGIRTNMVPVFDAVALDNPYARDYLNEPAWNQMYLKAAFMGRPLYKIEGVAKRSNAELSRMILDYVHERWAAGRAVSPEIWQPTKRFLSAEHVAALDQLMQHPNEIQGAAAALTLAKTSDSDLEDKVAIAGKEWTWEKIGMDWEKESK